MRPRKHATSGLAVTLATAARNHPRRLEDRRRVGAAVLLGVPCFRDSSHGADVGCDAKEHNIQALAAGSRPKGDSAPAPGHTSIRCDGQTVERARRPSATALARRTASVRGARGSVSPREPRRRASARDCRSDEAQLRASTGGELAEPPRTAATTLLSPREDIILWQAVPLHGGGPSLDGQCGNELVAATSLSQRRGRRSDEQAR